MKTLVHCTAIGGHQLEYIHHFYMGACKRPEREYIFLVPKRFVEDSKSLVWPESNNIKIDFFEEEEVNSIGDGLIKKPFDKAKNLGKYVKKYNVDKVVLIDLISYIPFIPLFVPSHVMVYGIIYRIYLYEWKEESKIKKVLDVIKYLVMSRCKVFSKVFILNDNSAANYLNKLYHTKKFSYLPDPVVSDIPNEIVDMRKVLNIAPDKIVLLHPGGMLPYKNTLNILRAISASSKGILDKFVFIFAGKVTEQIKTEFFILLAENKDRANIVLDDGFLPYSKLASYFKASDIILAPYSVKSQSSGIIGMSALHNKPVVVVGKGVIGKLVRRFHLGILLENPAVESIRSYLESPIIVKPQTREYVSLNSIQAFNTYIDI